MSPSLDHTGLGQGFSNPERHENLEPPSLASHSTFVCLLPRIAHCSHRKGWRIKDELHSHEALDGSAAIVISDNPPTFGVFLGSEALLDQRAANDPQLHTEDNPRHLGHQQILIGAPNGTPREWPSGLIVPISSRKPL